jgi:late competence protein required for DNA uptake (superfamily II DNA/RNA helicase)
MTKKVGYRSLAKNDVATYYCRDCGYMHRTKSKQGKKCWPNRQK